MMQRGIGFLCKPWAKKLFVAHYLMDTSTPDSRRRHLEKVGKGMDRLMGAG